MVGWQGPSTKTFSRLVLQLEDLQLLLAPGPGIPLESLEAAVRSLQTFYGVDLNPLEWCPRTSQVLKPKLRCLADFGVGS